MLGGNITVESVPGRGTVMAFEVPLTAIEAPEVPDEPPASYRVRLAEDSPRGQRVLVVDDVPENARLLLEWMRPLGLELREARDGLEALAVCQQWSPHLIWLDLRMPRMDGFEFTRQLQSQLLTPRPVIIALTAATSLGEDQDDPFSSAFDAFMRKPIRQADLLEKLRVHLGLRFVFDAQPAPAALPEPQIQAQQAMQDLLAAQPLPWRQRLLNALLRIDRLAVQDLLEALPPHPSSKPCWTCCGAIVLIRCWSCWGRNRPPSAAGPTPRAPLKSARRPRPRPGPCARQVGWAHPSAQK
ncbi:MAG: response regulator [Anaerolineae bacterium]|nr:response regulator [Anaerolineae bacterium]